MNTKNILTKIILSDLHLCFFYGFVFSIPFQIRKRFLTEHSYFAGGFSEYATFFVYLSDILLILAVFFWAVKITARRDGDSSRLRCVRHIINRVFCGHAMNRVSTILKSISKNLLCKRRDKSRFLRTCDKSRLYDFYYSITSNKNISLKILLLFCLWLVVDLLWISRDYFSISAYQTLKFLELAILFIYVYFNLTSFKRILTAVGLLALGGLIQSLLAVSQYFLQQSVFSSKWFGEIVLSPELSGVAKIAVDGEKIMRAYGTFPHPNILAGFLLLTIFLSWYLFTNYQLFINRAGKNRGFALANTLRKIRSITLRNKLDNLSRVLRNLKNSDNNVSRETLLNNKNKEQESSSLEGSEVRRLIKSVKFIKLKVFKTLNFLFQALYKFSTLIARSQHFLKREIQRNVSRETLLSALFTFLIFIQILALILTFSRSGWLGFFVVLFVLTIIPFLRGGWGCVKLVKKHTPSPSQEGKKGNKKLNVSRETFSYNYSPPCEGGGGGRFKNVLWKFSTLLQYFFRKEKSVPKNPSNSLLQKENSREGNKKLNVSRETLLSGEGLKTYPYENRLFNKNTLSILFLAIVTAFSVICLWPEIISRNLSEKSLVNLTVGNLVYHKKELRDYSNNVSRETLLDLENKESRSKDLAIIDRLFYNEVAINSINKYPFTGTGLGTFIFQIDNYLNVSRETFLNNENKEQKFPSREGSGVGYSANSIHPQPPLKRGIMEFWCYQPAHNIYLLIASEIGIAGFLIFALFIVQVIKEGWKNVLNKQNLEIQKENVSRETFLNNENKEQKFPSREGSGVGYSANSTHPQPPLKRGIVNNVSCETFDTLQIQRNLQRFLIAIFIGFLMIGMFDHYFWTLQQGRMEFWLILALIAANGRIIKSFPK